MTDNLAPTMENASPEIEQADVSAAPAQSAQPASIGWKASVNTDLRNSPLLQKFEDTPEGLNKALESHVNLEKLLGHEKVPIPKDANDVEGWNRFSKAMGIPDKAEQYGLPDVSLPESMKDMTIDKNKFAETVHAFKLTPSQAKGLWEAYSRENIEAYTNYQKEYEKSMTQVVNQLRSEWGDAYETNVELAQTVINKFSPDKETNDLITASMSKDPRMIKFLSKLGEQFAENKIADFQMKKFSLAPDEAQAEIDKIRNDLDGPYMNQKGKFTEREHQAAMARVNMLYEVINRAKGQV